ncbi:MAG: hypothetical protein M1828_000772 [Chrysothrix sp. TS-e1954]|nr:MAG: hypothetical protein M1828_000772 [Chrysothrix sp. TS-e1954]
MVTYRNITITLRSQYDVLSLPEFAPTSGSATGTPSATSDGASPAISPGEQKAGSQVSVFVPIYPSSQFWIDYSIEPTDPVPVYFFFKLFVNGTLFVNWGVGKEDNYRGKTMHGFFKRSEGRRLGKNKDSAQLERRSLFFSNRTDVKGSSSDIEEASIDLPDERSEMEIRVYRASSRRPAQESVDIFRKSRFNKRLSRGVELLSIGSTDEIHPRRFYDWALIDPPERPYASFRYFFRIWDELYALGIAEAPLDHAGGRTEARSTFGTKDGSRFREECSSFGD